jgi:hypothetical protein
MKQICFCVFFVVGILSVIAQSSTQYNIQGDQAFKSKDYQVARSFYSEGLDECNIYSIQRLADIWKTQPFLQGSMNLSMVISFNCLSKLSEADIPEAMLLLKDFYNEGIGTEKDSIRANYWLQKYGIAIGLTDVNQDINNNSSNNDTPKRSILSNHFSSFISYTYSPTMPFGGTAGIYFDKIGGYVSYRSDFKSVNAVYECNNTKVPAIDINNPPYEFGRESWNSRMITGGFL